MSNIIFKIYNSERIFLKDYNFDVKIRIYEIKSIILKDLFNNIYNDLDFENITFKIYKDFGKLFFDKGLLPNTIDNYKLGDFSNENRLFEFVVYPKNVEKKEFPKNTNGEILKKVIKEERIKNNKEFVIMDDDFPPLKRIK